MQELKKKLVATEAKRKKMRKALVGLRKKAAGLETLNHSLRNNTEKLYEEAQKQIKEKVATIKVLRDQQ